MAEPYSSIKIFHHIDRLKQLKNKEHPVPISFRLAISDLCNQNCHFCTFRLENTLNTLFSETDKNGKVTYNPKRFLDREKCPEVVKDAKEMGVKSIEFTGGGEPTVHPDHIEIFNAVLASGLDMGLITNGVLFRPDLIDTLLKATWVRFSVDAGTPSTYSQIRRVPIKTYTRVLENIRELVKRKKETKSDLTIGMSFIVTDQNYTEIYEAAKQACELGVDYLRVGHYWTDDGFIAGDVKITEELIEKSIKDFNREGFAVLNRYTPEKSKNIERPDYSFCAYQHISTWIAADYNVYRCCVTSYSNHGLIGSIKNQSFKQLWESELKRQRFDGFDAKSCTQCIYNDKNAILNYVISDSPAHSNFI